jgi:osmotically-inducible protein OsmY
VIKDRTVSRMSRSAPVLTFGAVIGLIAFLPVRLSAGEAQGDVRIKTAVESVIEEDGHLDLEELRISSHNGIVKLGGTVLTSDERALAGLLATQVSGVQGVENDIAVVPPLNQDVKLEKQVEDTLLENPLLHITELKIRARYGVITLRGIVREESERRLTDQLLSDLPGVVMVKNKLEVLE